MAMTRSRRKAENGDNTRKLITLQRRGVDAQRRLGLVVKNET